VLDMMKQNACDNTIEYHRSLTSQHEVEGLTRWFIPILRLKKWKSKLIDL